ncbi:MAG: hypothetical protein HYV27_14060 [Candidatus Hydrogenedentes bacterium]|nr:hypothetical protein [Candidatus Hydrogenedentota bacterium]
MTQWVLMILISLLAGLIVAGLLWLTMDLVPKIGAHVREWQHKRALAKQAKALEAQANEGENAK